jgi:hypothetical protein
VLLCALDQVRAKAISEGKSRRGAFIAFDSPPKPRSNLPRFGRCFFCRLVRTGLDMVSVDLKERFAKSEIDKTEFEEKRGLILESQASVRHDR